MKKLCICATLLVGVALGGCQAMMPPSVLGSIPDPKLTQRDQEMMALAPALENQIPYQRYLVTNTTGEPPGVIIVDTPNKKLYFTLKDGKAIQYPVATGAEAYGWTGVARVGHMTEWPTWMPTNSIMERWPEFQVYRQHGPLAGAYDNPLSARALYVFQGDHDTLYRIHGTNEPDEIGHAVSSGCIRMRDLDVIDLYNRVKVGTKIVVK